MSRIIPRKPQSNFKHYAKKIEAQGKEWFSLKKQRRVFEMQHWSEMPLKRRSENLGKKRVAEFTFSKVAAWSLQHY